MSFTRPSDHGVEQVVGRLLQIGVALSALVVIIGGAIVLAHHGADIPSYSTFRGEPESFRTLSGIFHGMLQGSGPEIVQFGLLLLISTPILRVAFTLVAFILQRDRLYMLVTSIVLVLLLYGLISGRGGAS
jgi:uncharacterized membrane protein